ncbi:MAG: Regulator of RpoS [Anaerolineae bacterium]|nr:Regulator of RpoS [Anaerolineae bacterium]
MASKERILIVDDDTVTLKLASHVFEKAGYEVFTASHGSEGLQKVENLQPALIILDVMMPDMSGLEVCERLRANPATAWLPIILLSAKTAVDDKLDGFQAGADDYVAKPVSHKELLARAGALLARSRRVLQPKGRVIAVVGVKGGVGVTTVATNVATQLALQEKPVILAELRANRGTVRQNLNISPAEDLGGLLLKNPADIKTTDVARRVVQHTSGVRLLVSPLNSAQDALLTEAHVNLILETLMTQAAYVLLDLPAISGSGVQWALEKADQILLVLEPEAVSIACARDDLELLKSWSLLDRTRLTVVSRARSSNLIAPADIEKELGISVIGVIPPSPEVFYLTASLGKPAVLSKPDTLAAESLVKLTYAVVNHLPVATAAWR